MEYKSVDSEENKRSLSVGAGNNEKHKQKGAFHNHY